MEEVGRPGRADARPAAALTDDELEATRRLIREATQHLPDRYQGLEHLGHDKLIAEAHRLRRAGWFGDQLGRKLVDLPSTPHSAAGLIAKRLPAIEGPPDPLDDLSPEARENALYAYEALTETLCEIEHKHGSVVADAVEDRAWTALFDDLAGVGAAARSEVERADSDTERSRILARRLAARNGDRQPCFEDVERMIVEIAEAHAW